MNWKLADAMDQFSELVTLALSEGPQRVQWRDQAVIVLGEADYNRLAEKQAGFVDFLRSGPGLGGLDLERDSSPMRGS